VADFHQCVCAAVGVGDAAMTFVDYRLWPLAVSGLALLAIAVLDFGGTIIGRIIVGVIGVVLMFIAAIFGFERIGRDP
jgi:hypothetical protein